MERAIQDIFAVRTWLRIGAIIVRTGLKLDKFVTILLTHFTTAKYGLTRSEFGTFSRYEQPIWLPLFGIPS